MRVTDEMVDAAIAADSHASWWAGNNREGAEKRMRAALEAALAVEGTEVELARDGNPFGWVRRSETDGNPPAYHFTCNKTTAEKWARRGESPTALYTTPPAGIREALETAIKHIEHMAAWIGKQNAGYSFESLGEDMDGLRAVLRGQS